MFTLKLYQNGQGMPGSRCIVIECVGIWSDICRDGVKHVRAFPKEVGVAHDGMQEFFVGGDIKAFLEGQKDPVVSTGIGGNYFDWAVLENSQGKTTEMLR